ncbi:MAG: AMP-binding protein [Rhodoferax sp.]
MHHSQSSDIAPAGSGAISSSTGLPAAYLQQHAAFGWAVPEYFNIAQECCARWAAAPDGQQRVAIRSYVAGGASTSYTYAALQARANQLSNCLRALGVVPGDRVALVMPQCFETAVAYMAVLQMGAVAMPLSMLFGPDALEFRLSDSAAVLAICDAQALAAVQAARPACKALRAVLGVGPDQATQGACEQNLDAAVAPYGSDFAAVATRADAAAVLIYTSGTTGNPKGALIAQRALLGNLSGFVCSQNGFGRAAASALQRGATLAVQDAAPAEAVPVFWSPADWAWTGGLMDALLPKLYYGASIVAYHGRFAPQTALELMGQCAVSHTFLFPTALKAMMKAYPGAPGHRVRDQFGLRLQALLSAGEAVGDAVFAYCATQLGVQPNEMFGQTEINYIVGNCVALWPAKPGSMGMGYPGHLVRVIDDEGNECPTGVAGDVAVRRHDVHGVADPVFFLGYWNNPAATEAKFSGSGGQDDWCRTGDLALRDADGYLWYQGRSDDVFKAAGYRIGPGEIENCLVKHPAVANVAVVPKPDPERGALVKAYVVIAPGYLAAHAVQGTALADFHASLVVQLQDHVKGLLAPYEYPKEIEFIEALPMTTTGKVQRRVLRMQ